MHATLVMPPHRLVGVHSTRPDDPQIGDRWWQPVDEILNGWTSIDGANPNGTDGRYSWDDLLAEKRYDWHYEMLVEELKTRGFRAYLGCETYGGEWCFGDGHHRLAVAVEQGWSVVPVILNLCGRLRVDSGDWEGGDVGRWSR